MWFENGRVKIHIGVEADFRPARKAHPALLVKDLQLLIDRLKSAGYQIHADEPLEGFVRAFVNDPFGNFYCVDDSFATVNPTIDFNNPANGSYDIWIGSYASGTLVPGTFYVTANTANHP